MDCLITDLDEIENLSRAMLDQNLKFRAFLEQLDWSDSKLDSLVYEIWENVNSQIDCTTCANCCREMGIAVEDADIARLSQRLQIGAEEFESRYVAVDEGEKFMPQTPCKFLGGDLCTVYEDRPCVCREFPHLHKEDFRHRLIGVFGSASVCSIVYNVLEELKLKLEWRPRS